MKIGFGPLGAETLTGAAGAVIAAVGEGAPSKTAAALDTVTGGALSRAAKAAGFEGKAGQVLDVMGPSGMAADRLILVGLGDEKAADALGIETAGGHAMARLASGRSTEATVAVLAETGVGASDAAARIAAGMRLRSYRFDVYRTTMKDADKPALKRITVATAEEKAAKKAFKVLDAVIDGVFMARDLVNEPANILHPEEFASRIKALEKAGLDVEVLGEKEMEKLGMGSLLGVGQGSVRESQLAIMRWNGGAKGAAPVAFVGKGVCFDTGGISLKGGAGMHEMTMDMGGAAAVTGAMLALAGRKAKVNAVGVVGLVENMPDGNAQRPGDVVTSMSGQTIEVNNTDAEGRLVLADALWYTQDRFKPQFMVDLATLTGAIIIALGHEYAGLFSNNDDLSANLGAAGKASGERVWRQPLGEEYNKKLKSRVADMANITGGRDAGSITAACFLERFVNKLPWAHLDIAGTAYRTDDQPTVPKYGTGYGVRLLDQLVADHYEG